MDHDHRTLSITHLLQQLQEGHREAFNQLFEIVYPELLILAKKQRHRWKGDYTLNTTALVHETYQKLVGASAPEWENRRHFFRVATRAMRHILVNYAERKNAQRRGGEIAKVTLENDELLIEHVFNISEERALRLLSIDDALKRLETISKREAEIVEFRFFADMSVKDTAEIMGLSEATVKRGWAMAKAWLYTELKESMLD